MCPSTGLTPDAGFSLLAHKRSTVKQRPVTAPTGLVPQQMPAGVPTSRSSCSYNFHYSEMQMKAQFLFLSVTYLISAGGDRGFLIWPRVSQWEKSDSCTTGF